MTFITMSNREDKLKLYNDAKEAYYNGQEIMSDLEFDQLEKELGLENKAYVGSKHSESYVVKHPYMMGSLSKVQIHSQKDGSILWDEYVENVLKYIGKDVPTIITPKFDGCSFEISIANDKVVGVSSRGDGEYGKDLFPYVNEIVNIGEIENMKLGTATLRGELLVDNDTFINKYEDQFTNPRSFVSGTLGHIFDKNDVDHMSNVRDMKVVIYDFKTYSDDGWTDHDWTDLNGTYIERFLPEFYSEGNIIDRQNFENTYWIFNEYRKKSRYALDGIVIKPIAKHRIYNTTEARPKDCVAIKFMPLIKETTVNKITWNLGKTGELIPIIWFDSVVMDGRNVVKCSGHNYGYVRDNGLGIGAKIIVSLAGDIIPFMYKVIERSDNNIELPKDYSTYVDGDIHLMASLTDKDLARMKFVASANSLGIPNIGTETAKSIFEYLSTNDKTTADFFGETLEYKYNILECSSEEVFFGAGGGQIGKKAKASFEKIIKDLTLTDIIVSMSFKQCGRKVAEQCTEKLLGGQPDFSHLSQEGYEWTNDENSDNYKELVNVVEKLGKNIGDFKEIHEEAKQTSSNKIPVIMTGEPNDYDSKAEFLRCHPEYRNTTKWKEVKIVFTNSFESNTGKMKKARELGIEIRLY